MFSGGHQHHCWYGSLPCLRQQCRSSSPITMEDLKDTTSEISWVLLIIFHESFTWSLDRVIATQLPPLRRDQYNIIYDVIIFINITSGCLSGKRSGDSLSIRQFHLLYWLLPFLEILVAEVNQASYNPMLYASVLSQPNQTSSILQVFVIYFSKDSWIDFYFGMNRTLLFPLIFLLLLFLNSHELHPLFSIWNHNFDSLFYVALGSEIHIWVLK